MQLYHAVFNKYKIRKSSNILFLWHLHWELWEFESFLNCFYMAIPIVLDDFLNNMYISFLFFKIQKVGEGKSERVWARVEGERVKECERGARVRERKSVREGERAKKNFILLIWAGMRIRHFLHGSGWEKNADPDPTLSRNEEKNIFIFQVGRH